MKNNRNLERFDRFLKNNQNDFLKSIKADDVKKVIKYLNVSDDMFFNASLKTLQDWGFKLKTRPDFIKHGKIKQTKISNAFQAFIGFCFSLEGKPKEIVVDKAAKTKVVKHVGLKKLVSIKKVLLTKVRKTISKIKKFNKNIVSQFYKYTVCKVYSMYKVKIISFAKAA